MHIAIIPGHGHRSRNGAYRYDPGAVSSLGQEADIVRDVAAAVKRLGGSRGSIHDSPGGGPYTYGSRRYAAHQAIGKGPGVVCHLHVNAGGGRYLLSMFDPRSATGEKYALGWSLQAESQFSGQRGLSKAKCLPAARPTWNNAANLIEPSYSSTPAGVAAVLLEIGFIDNPAHAPMLTGEGIAKQAQAIWSAWR